jgi:hypothetical protein
MNPSLTDATAEISARQPLAKHELDSVVEDVLASTPFVDIHTHLFAPEFGSLGLWGIDDLLTYHYLEAELFRSSAIRPAQYWALNKSQRADAIWQALFVENTPISEATRGVVAILDALGLDTRPGSLRSLREFFREQDFEDHLARVLCLAGVCSVVMTNDPLNPEEVALWDGGIQPDKRFHAALRLDRILNEEYGSAVGDVRRFLLKWAARTNPVYFAVSLPDSFEFPAEDARTRLLIDSVLPLCRELDIPLAMMIGVRRQVNPELRLAGDAAGRADLRALERMCQRFPDNRFLVSVLSRENQHELCVYARKFSNLMPFGCWWFLNSPSVVEEITRERLELLGTSFVPQHSDARILEQLIYKWRSTRQTLGPVLARAYERVCSDGRVVTREDIQRDVNRLFRDNFARWM